MTHKELASKFDISPTAFSLIINNKPGIAAQTRSRVIEGLEQLGLAYLVKKAKPSAALQNLCFIIYKRHGEILDQHPFFLLLIENIEVRARELGYKILLSTIDKRRETGLQIEQLNQMDAKGGIIFATEMQQEDIALFSAVAMPCVALDHYFPTQNINTVSINNEMGAFQAVEHLVQMGHTHIGYLKSKTRISSFEERERGFHSAMAYFGLALCPACIYEVSYSEKGSNEDFMQILRANPKLPTAFVTDDDTIAAGVMEALAKHAYKIPEEISLVGFNNRPVCNTTVPPLTSIDVSKQALAYEAVNEVVRLIQGQEENTAQARSRKLRMGTKLIVRQSVFNRRGS